MKQTTTKKNRLELLWLLFNCLIIRGKKVKHNSCLLSCTAAGFCFVLPWWQAMKNLPATWETWVWSLGQEDSFEKGMATHSRQRSLVGYSGWGRKEPDTTEWLSHHNFLILSSADGHLGHFHVLTIVNSAAMKTRVHVSLSVLVSSGYMPSSGIAESYGVLVPVF